MHSDADNEKTMNHSGPKKMFELRVSFRSRRLFNQLAGQDRQNQEAASLSLEKYLDSLKQDKYILLALRDALLSYLDSEITEELREQALETCKSLVTHCYLSEASVVISHGRVDKAVPVLKSLIELDPQQMTEDVQLNLFGLLISVIWHGASGFDTEQFLHVAQSLDKDGRHQAYLRGLNRLLSAREEMNGDHPEIAIRQCQMLAKELRKNDPLLMLAKQMEADVFRQINDHERELRALEDWLELFGPYTNGPCDMAVAEETTKRTVGIMGGLISEEILQHYSRLACLYESQNETKPYAEGIYRHFLNTAYHRWIDPDEPQKGTIQERLSNLGSPEDTLREDSKFSPTSIMIIEPERNYGHISDETLDSLIERLNDNYVRSIASVCISRVGIKENRFEFSGSGADLINNMLKTTYDICKSDEADAYGLEPSKSAVIWRNHPTDWIILSQNEPVPDLSRLSFGVQVTLVSNWFDVSVYVLFTCQPPLEASTKEELADILRRKPEDITGYGPLEDRVVRIIKKAAKRVAQASASLNEIPKKGLRKL